jgi:hypothetical protein
MRGTPGQIAAPRSAPTQPTSGGEASAAAIGAVVATLSDPYLSAEIVVYHQVGKGAPDIHVRACCRPSLCSGTQARAGDTCRSQNFFDTVIPMVRGWI